MLRVQGAFLLPALGFEYVRQRWAAAGNAGLVDARWWAQTALRAWPFLIMIAGVAFMLWERK